MRLTAIDQQSAFTSSINSNYHARLYSINILKILHYIHWLMTEAQWYEQQHYEVRTAN